jgi:hypothetical protein
MFFKKYKYARLQKFRHVRDYEHRKIKRRVKRFLKETLIIVYFGLDTRHVYG